MPLIQIIDDDVILLSSLSFQLEEAGFNVHRSSELTHAEQTYAEERPDLILLEVRSDRDRGWDLLARIAPMTPVIVISSASREEDIVRGFAAGAVDYIAKPYRSAELIARLRTRLALPSPEPPAVESFPKTSTTDQLMLVPPPPQRHTKRREDEEESVFMSEAEEMAMLRMPSTQTSTPAVEIPPLDGNESLGKRLRNERIRRHLTLVQVENDLKIRMSYLQAIEDEKYTLIPRGPVAITMLRSYVSFLGIDPEPVISEFRAQHYVEPHEPLPALGGVHLPRSLPRWIIWVIAITLALIIAIGAIFFFDPGFFQRIWMR